MKIITTALLTLSVLVVAGCHHHNHPHHGGHFCPPGQAKKGNC
jgi:hypothetical protein